MCRIDLSPGLDDGQDLSRPKVGQGEVVLWGEGDDIALSCHRLGAQEQVGQACDAV